MLVITRYRNPIFEICEKMSNTFCVELPQKTRERFGLGEKEQTSFFEPKEKQTVKN